MDPALQAMLRAQMGHETPEKILGLFPSIENLGIGSVLNIESLSLMRFLQMILPGFTIHSQREFSGIFKWLGQILKILHQEGNPLHGHGVSGGEHMSAGSSVSPGIHHGGEGAGIGYD
ncbi:MAG: hypothetical protein IT567_02845 [Alphaproteobacteria bacterium]|nr:hypothetical protein [Alphaproteobacteria bacterium]